MRVPLFPLPNLVLFPGVVLPLYVFEDRYRQLLADVQASGRPFGIVRILERSRDSALPLHERVSTLGTLAYLREATRHEDGTSTVAVVGGERFRITDFDLTRPYLSADVEAWPLETAGVQGGPLDSPALAHEAAEAEARSLLARLLRSRPGDAEALRRAAPADPLLLASFAATLLPLSAEQKEALLAAPTLLDRLEGLLASLPADTTLN